MSRKIAKLFLVLVAGVLFGVVSAVADTATIYPQQDNTIFQDNVDYSNGSGSVLFSGNTSTPSIRRALIQFDVASVIPSATVINSVTLRMSVTKAPAGPATVAMTFHRVNASWGEGTSSTTLGTGVQAVYPDATWNDRFFGVTAWTNPGGDYDAAVHGSASVSGVGSYTFASTAEMVQDVQDWLNNPAENYGWVLRGDEVTAQTVRQFGSKENTTESARPLLTVDYTDLTAVGPGGPLALRMSIAPNPSRGLAHVTFSLPRASEIHLAIYDVRGRQVAVLENGTEFSEGVHTVSWNGRTVGGQPVAAGVYFARLITPTDGMRTVRVLRVR